MKIIKRIADNAVLFAGDDLILDENGCSGSGWVFRAIDPSELTLETVAEIPDGFIGGGWMYSAGAWAMTATGEQSMLPEKRSAKIAELTAARLAFEYSDITHAGEIWKADKDARALLAQVLAPGSIRANAYWRDAAGIKHTMTYSDLQALGCAISDRGYDADENLETKKAAVNAAMSAAEIDSITWEE